MRRRSWSLSSFRCCVRQSSKCRLSWSLQSPGTVPAETKAHLHLHPPPLQQKFPGGLEGRWHFWAMPEGQSHALSGGLERAGFGSAQSWVEAACFSPLLLQARNMFLSAYGASVLFLNLKFILQSFSILFGVTRSYTPMVHPHFHACVSENVDTIRMHFLARWCWSSAHTGFLTAPSQLLVLWERGG